MRPVRPIGRNKSCRPALEVLEARLVLAQFGVPWHDPTHLSVSFAPDGTSIAGHPSTLFQTLDANEPAAEWQAQILQAFQAWSDQANIDFSVSADGGEPFGTPGPDQHDPRFGDIRIGAQPMPANVLAIAVPHDPFLSGTWSGDILLNSTVSFGTQNVDLLPVMLHEVGHALGLPESDDPGSVMFSQLNLQNTTLSQGDIAAVQALYGTDSDDPSTGSVWNNPLQTATPFPAPDGFDGTTPLFQYAHLSTDAGAGVYSVQVPAGASGPVTIRLQTAGVSLLMPRLSVYDGWGKLLADVSSDTLGGDTLRVTLPHVDAGATFYVEARAAANDTFNSGEYALAVNFDARSTVSSGQIDTLARQSYSYLSPNDLNAIFLHPTTALFHNDHHTDDTFATAAPLAPATDGYGVFQAPDRITASVSDPTDSDFYQIETPSAQWSTDGSTGYALPLVMTVTGRATEVNGIMPLVAVFDANHDPVPAQVLAHGDGTYTIQVPDAQPSATYYVRVSGDPTSGKVVGNYDLDVEYGSTVASPTTFVSGTISSSMGTSAYELVVDESQLFSFLLANTTAQAPVTMTLTDSSGHIEATRTASPGDTSGGDGILLLPGVYRVTFSDPVTPGAFPRAVSFRLYGANLTDPIGPSLDDPTHNPIANPAPGVGDGIVPPVVGSADTPYSWLALTLAAPQGSGATLTTPLSEMVAVGPGSTSLPSAPVTLGSRGTVSPLQPLKGITTNQPTGSLGNAGTAAQIGPTNRLGIAANPAFGGVLGVRSPVDELIESAIVLATNLTFSVGPLPTSNESEVERIATEWEPTAPVPAGNSTMQLVSAQPSETSDGGAVAIDASAIDRSEAVRHSESRGRGTHPALTRIPAVIVVGIPAGFFWWKTRRLKKEGEKQASVLITLG